MLLPRHYAVATLLGLAACGGGSTGPDGGTLSGDYRIDGEQVGANVPGPWTFRVISQDEDRIVIDWISGALFGEVPIRDTAQWNETAYRLDWRATAGGTMYIARIVGTSCTGQSFNTLGGTGPWSSCTITRP